MKKQIKKLTVNKKTISNLRSSEMNKYVGGTLQIYGCGNHSKNCTQNQNTCAGHNTCN